LKKNKTKKAKKKVRKIKKKSQKKIQKKSNKKVKKKIHDFKIFNSIQPHFCQNTFVSQKIRLKYQTRFWIQNAKNKKRKDAKILILLSVALTRRKPTNSRPFFFIPFLFLSLQCCNNKTLNESKSRFFWQKFRKR